VLAAGHRAAFASAESRDLVTFVTNAGLILAASARALARVTSPAAYDARSREASLLSWPWANVLATTALQPQRHSFAGFTAGAVPAGAALFAAFVVRGFRAVVFIVCRALSMGLSRCQFQQIMQRDTETIPTD
jgi:hypothetical protein